MESFINESQTGQVCMSNNVYFKLWAFCGALCFFIGCPASVMVLKELHKRSHHRAFRELFMLNVTIADLSYNVCMPLILLPFMWKNKSLIWFYKFIDAIALCTRPLFMACICVDCYYAVLYPIMYRTNKNSNLIRSISCVIVWLITICFSEPYCLKTCSVLTYIYSFPLIVALPVMTFCNISILQVLRKPDPSRNNNIHPQKKRALHTIFNSMIMIFITYIPPVIIFLSVSLPPLSKMVNNCKVVMVGYLLSMAGTLLMPLLYLDTMGKFDYWRKKKIVTDVNA